MTPWRRIIYVSDQPYERRYGTAVEDAVVARDQRTLDDIRAGHAWVPPGLLTLT